MHYIDSASMLQKFLTAVISEEWARECDSLSPSPEPLIEKSSLAKELSKRTLEWLQGKPPASYHEMAFTLSRIHADCIALLQSFSLECKLPISSIPFLGSEIDITGVKPGCFTVETAQSAVGTMYTRLKDSLGRTKKRELALISEKRNKVVASIDRYIEVKAQHDIRVSAAFAAAFVSFKSTPDKVSPVVKGIMNGIKVCFVVVHVHMSIPDTLIRMKKILICKTVRRSLFPLSSNFAQTTTSRSRQTR